MFEHLRIMLRSRRRHLELVARQATGAGRAARARAGASRRSGLRSAGGAELSDLQTFIQSIESIHVVVVELEVEKLSVRLDAVLRKTLGKDDVSMRQTPLEQNPEACEA